MKDKIPQWIYWLLIITAFWFVVGCKKEDCYECKFYYKKEDFNTSQIERDTQIYYPCDIDPIKYEEDNYVYWRTLSTEVEYKVKCKKI